MSDTYLTPEAKARLEIDSALESAGWVVQSINDGLDLSAARGVAVREVTLKTGHGKADYILYVDHGAIGAIEAKKPGTTLTGVETQSGKYSQGLPEYLPAWHRPLPFLYESTGAETQFTNLLDPTPRSRAVFSFHRPETLIETFRPTGSPATTYSLIAELVKPGPTLRERLTELPPLIGTGLWPAQARAICSLEESLAKDRSRALIQMATGSGKTITAISSIYRLIKFAGVRRVLFLVDRANLGRQALKEFQQYTTPDDGRKFGELYNVQLLQSNTVDPVARVVITTIQRLYSILQGKEDFAVEDEEGSQFEGGAQFVKPPDPVVYNPSVPIEEFEVVFTDECHRSIYNLWRQVLEYFDAYIVGLTATPSLQTLGFFKQNLVMDYGHEQAVADGVNVPFDLYRIRTKITEGGSKVDSGYYVDRRDRLTRKKRAQLLDQDLVYSASQLDRDVVAEDQIRTVIKAFHDKLPIDIFPGRKQVPKTLIFAKDDSHAEDIVKIVREEFDQGNDFAQKITYKAGTAKVVTVEKSDDGQEFEVTTWKSSGVKSEELLSSFRNSYNPRIAVTVDMLATGTDVKPIEIVMFMRSVKSRNFFEQMKGRGVRVINSSDLQLVTEPNAVKDRFVVVDCVGLCEQDMADSHPLEKKPSMSLEQLFRAVALGSTDPEFLSSIAGRLARLDRRLDDAQRKGVAQTAGGLTLNDISSGIVQALDPDRQIEHARETFSLPAEAEPSDAQLAAAAQQLLVQAAKPLSGNPDLRKHILDVQKRLEQVIDSVSQDAVLEAGYSEEAKEKAQATIKSFEQFIDSNKDAITALQVLYSRPYKQRLHFGDVKQLIEEIKSPPRSWTPERLWRAYETLEQDRVRGASEARQLTDLVSLVRFALHQDEELAPFAERVHERFEQWLAQQASHGVTFTKEQLTWLEAIRDHIAGSLEMDTDAFGYTPFQERGGLGKAYRLFGDKLPELVADLNQALAA